MVHPHTVHLPHGALLSPCTVCVVQATMAKLAPGRGYQLLTAHSMTEPSTLVSQRLLARPTKWASCHRNRLGSDIDAGDSLNYMCHELANTSAPVEIYEATNANGETWHTVCHSWQACPSLGCHRLPEGSAVAWMP